MSKWVSGSDLLKAFDIRDIELFEWVQKGLQPYTRLGKTILPRETQAKRSELKFWQGQLEFLERDETRLRVDSEDDLAESIEEAKGNVERIKAELASKEDNPWKDVSLPDSGVDAKETLKELVNALYKVEDVKKVVEVLPERNGLLAALGDKAASIQDTEAGAMGPTWQRQESVEEEAPESPPQKRKKRKYHKPYEKCQEVARKLWGDNPYLSTAYIIRSGEIREVRQYFFERYGWKFTDKTIRGWIQDLNPRYKGASQEPTA